MQCLRVLEGFRRAAIYAICVCLGAAVFFLTGCDSNENEIEDYSSAIINPINVSVPLNGEWDDATGPDVYIEIRYFSNDVGVYQSKYAREDVTKDTVTFIPDLRIEDLSETYVIQVFDYDENTEDDLIAQADWNLEDLQDWPESHRMIDSGTRIELFIEWLE